MVFASHAGSLGIGWTGVPLFFVLSGLLITGILRRDRCAAAFWAPFYIKRATRIMPPLVIAFAITAIFFSYPWRTVGPYLFLFAANFGQVAHPKTMGGLGVLWSLAVEEQFYLLWPFAIRFLHRRQLIILLLCLLAIEPIVRAIASPFFQTYEPIYFLTPFQLDGLAAGSLLALLLEDPVWTEHLRQWSGRVLLVTFALLAGLSFLPVFTRDANSLAFNSLGYSLVDLVAVSFIAYVLLSPANVLSRALGTRVMISIGAITYGMYLFHDLLIDLVMKYGRSTLAAHPVRLAMAALPFVYGLAWLSFHLYEKPILRWGRRKAAQLSGLREQSVYTSPEVIN